MKLESIALKKFLWKFNLKTGACCVAIFYTIVLIFVLLGSIVELIAIEKYDATYRYPWNRPHAYTISAIIFAATCLLVNILFLIRLRKGKLSMVLSWLVLTTVWVLLNILLLIIISCTHRVEMSLACWILASILTVVYVVLMLYGLLIGFSYWVELKNSRRETPQEV